MIRDALPLQEDGIHLLMTQLIKALEEPSRRAGAVALVQHWASTTRLDFQENVPQLLQVRL